MLCTPTRQGIPAPVLPFLHHSTVRYQQPAAALIEKTILLGEGALSDTGALVIQTGTFTGRSPKDKFIVDDAITHNAVHWNSFNQPMDEKYFFIIRDKVQAYLGSRETIWVRDCLAGADKNYQLSVRVITEKPWMDLFASNMFLHPPPDALKDFAAEWTILSAPGLQLDPATCATRQGNAAVISFTHKTILIAGTGYTGEIKKGVFTVLNFLLPRRKVLSMHCAANRGATGDTALFFGLSGTGKTTLSADSNRQLLGDDEHAWSPEGISNLEGGCYAKTIDLSESREPAIFGAIRHGALLENTRFVPGTHQVDYADKTITENTRVSYPLRFISNALQPSTAGHPSHIFFLTCDAYGVLPPVAKLTMPQAMYHFISGYTAKIAGTETGVTEPKSTFSACFGAPFLPLHPALYAAQLAEKMQEHPVHIWLINTGWTGGGYGTGKRIELSHTRAIISAVLQGTLNDQQMPEDPLFRFAAPRQCPGVPPGLLDVRETWANKSAYDIAAGKLARAFIENFNAYADKTDREVQAAGPILSAQ